MVVAAGCTRESEQGHDSLAGEKTPACVMQAIDPPWLSSSPSDSQLAADRVLPPGAQLLAYSRPDINCDGTEDLILQYRVAPPSDSIPLVFFVRVDGALRELLRTTSMVDGREGLVAAGDANADGWLDLVLLGYDEGGLVPRVFGSTFGRLAELAVADLYYLPQSDEWDADCLRALSPRMTEEGGVVLARMPDRKTENRRPSACPSPRDTLDLRSLPPKAEPFDTTR